ncbi:MAG: sulfurtransferase-like selenium metabolism protein YedF [Chitinispirillaceae bacterium]|nr:sulfurtransferase-like selenium metabolism protein YedF [Chitinispirillaceae bacterium]
MNEYLVDARGELCPKPLIMTKKALKECADGQPMRILIDNETSKNNVVSFLTDNGFNAEVQQSEEVYSLLLHGASGELVQPDAASYCTTAPAAPHTIVIKSNRMGIGDDELGEVLLKAFINTISEVEPLPGSVVFYNSGVFMATDESPVAEALLGLEKAGVTLLVCGTCADFFHLKDRISVGTISNMYTILETITAAGKIIEP